MRAVATWPRERLPEAVEVLASRSGLAEAGTRSSTSIVLPDTDDESDVGTWMGIFADSLGVEVESLAVPLSDVSGTLAYVGPAICRLEDVEGEARYALILGGASRGRLRLLGSDRRVHRVAREVVERRLTAPIEAPYRGWADRILDGVEGSSATRAAMHAAILANRLDRRKVGGIWMFRPEPGGSFVRTARLADVPRFMVGALGAHVLQYVLTLTSLGLIGRAALEGRIAEGWFYAWVLLLLSSVPIQLAASWLQGRFSIAMGALIKSRLLVGALRLEPEVIRHEGAGQLLGRVMESNAVGSLVLGAGFSTPLALAELCLAGVVLSAGAGGVVHAVVLFVWVGCMVLLGLHLYRRDREASRCNIELTNHFVETMLGHRTRLVQEEVSRWHDGEDEALERYLTVLRRVDRASIALDAASRAWWIGSIAVLTPALVAGGAQIGAVAVSLGGTFLAAGALSALGQGLAQLSRAAIGWQQARPMFDAATRRSSAPTVVLPTSSLPAEGSDAAPSTSAPASPVLAAHDLVFRHSGRAAPVLEGLALEVFAGDRILLEGASGCGKSTLASLMCGLRVPESGLLLLRGLDRSTLGASGWRRHVVAAPQFHENHVIGASLSFNLLMGKDWPPSEAELGRAEAVCRELGLGTLLDRMPSGIHQMVGENGWQLSHGERSRLYIARALLQDADVVVLDESFAALDPENLVRCMSCVLQRARTVLVIAHP